VSGKTDVGFVYNRVSVTASMLYECIKDTFCTSKHWNMGYHCFLSM